MTTHPQKISAVPTHLITGFLGAGKTTAIKQLLARKPAGERWAVLVNEFGEIGIDGSLFESEHEQQQGVFIREVPGGCMCCAAGVPMQVALNQLLAKARPERLLIEPTGLGHPQEVLQVLTSGAYRDVLALAKVVTLVDARNLADSRYTKHATFNQQIAIADLVVGNKADLYSPDDKARLLAYIAKTAKPGAELIFAEHGEIGIDRMTGKAHAPARNAAHHDHDHHHDHDQPALLAADQPLPECGYLRAVNSGEGYCSIGWRFAAQKVFKRSKLFWFLNGLQAERMKAVINTDDGVFGYNLTTDTLTETQLAKASESRIEIIASQISDRWETDLLACLILDDSPELNATQLPQQPTRQSG